MRIAAHRARISLPRSRAVLVAGALLPALIVAPGIGPAAAITQAPVGPAAAPSAAVVVQPTVTEVPLGAIDPAVLAAAPAPHEHPDEASAGSVRALGAGTTLVRPAAAATVTIAEPAELIAVTADEPFPNGAAISVRVRDSAGWSEWTELAADPEHGPDPGSPEARDARTGTDPLMAQGATSAQVRIDTPSGTLPAGTELTLVDAPTAPSDASTGLAALGTASKPAILTRAQWGADESWRGRAPYYTDNIRAGFIHHTASTSNYSKSQAAAQIRSIYAYHTKSLNHSDIDYNFVVDRFGQLYEGRAGGMDRPVLGGHTAGFNEHTFAAVVLGNFSTFSPSASEMTTIKDSLARLFAWKLGLSGVSPDSTVNLTSAGFVRPTRYAKGSVATISATSSHQTVNYTSCPGTALQGQLASIRAQGGRYSNVVISAPTPADSRFTSGSRSSVTFATSTNRAVTWTADLLSPCSDTPVRRITGKSSKAGPFSIRWDLRDSAGRTVLPANYTLRISGSAADGTPVPTVSTSLAITPASGQAWGPCGDAGAVVATPPPIVKPAPTPTTKYKVARTNASPEPIGKGRTLRVQVKTVQAKFTDGKYRKVPAGVAFTVQFKATGKKYKTIASGVTIKGKARTYLKATKSGRWRILVGTQKTKSDYVRVKK